MTTVMAQAGIESEQVYRSWDDGFGAVLSGEQVDAVRDIPGVGPVEQDTEGRPAPYARMTSGDRIDGSYFVDVTPGTDPTVVAARLGLTPSYVFVAMPGFSADMTEVQLDSARRDPEVTYVEDNSYVYLDD
ncbi:protease inhibitor I9 family protein [Micromonospora sp. NPDC048835]|uniref:protease inhibitor I9 family protein n=1 Tax=Micromonospora sp. NPDC048835 TaxID=3155147 RepID=UPI0033FF5294